MKHIKYYVVFALCFIMQWSFAQIGGMNPYQKKLNPGGKIYSPFIPPNNPGNPGVNPISPPGEDTRRVFWIHGLNGSTGTWSSAAFASQYGVNSSQGLPFAGRKLESTTNLTYNQDHDIWTAGAELFNSIELYKRNPALDTLNFIIAHSQGGIVSRAMTYNRACRDGDNIDAMPYGGIVTFATPHGGAQILNNKEVIIQLGKETCSDYLAGPIARKIHEKKILKLFLWGLNISGNDLADKFCAAISSWVEDLVLPSQAPNITNSYKVGAPDLELLNTGTCESDIDRKTHKMAFWGVENPDGLMFRTNKYFLTSPNLSPYFDANIDQDAVDNHKKSRSNYLAEKKKYELKLKNYKRIRRLCILSKGVNPFGAGYCLFNELNIKTCKEVIRGFERGIRWHDRIDDQYKVAIGALTYQTTVEPGWCRCRKKDKKFPDPREFKIDNNNPCQPNIDESFCHTFTKVETERVYKDNDGVVLAESATAFPRARVDREAMFISSHMQLRNNEETRNRLNRLYDGKFDKFFYTDKK